MGSMSIWHWIIVLAVGLLLFGGRGKISELMGDMAKGIKEFKKGMADEPANAPPPAASEPARNLEHRPDGTGTPVATPSSVADRKLG